MKPLSIALPLVLGAASACNWGQVCTLEARPGIRVTVVDSATGSAVAETATVIANAGSYADTATFPPVAFLAEERPGFYRVEARAPGYAPWTSPMLQVTRDECHVRTVEVTARLQQTSPSPGF